MRAMASLRNIDEMHRRNSVSKTEFSRCERCTGIMPASEPLEPRLFFFQIPSQSTPDHGPGTPIFKGKSPFSPQPSVLRTGGWHQSTGVFIALTTVPYSSACHVPPSLFIYITIPGAAGDSPAGLGGNDVIRRLLHFGRRRRGRHSTGVLFARPPMSHSTISHAPISRYYNFSHQNGGGIQQQLASPLPLPNDTLTLSRFGQLTARWMPCSRVKY